jgi:Lar family restriction alleviation protein
MCNGKYDIIDCQQEIKLASCPFCGGEAEFVRSNLNHCYVQCLDCFIIGKSSANKVDAVKTWNTRVDK